jgi:hypothetical protein
VGGLGGFEDCATSFLFMERVKDMHIDTESGSFEITDVLLQAWMTRFPTVDLRREWPLMVLWITKNPAKKPKNPIRFIENWLKRTHANELRNLEETSKRGAASAERVGSRYGCTPQPGETQEAFNRRVIAASVGSLVSLKRVA